MQKLTNAIALFNSAKRVKNYIKDYKEIISSKDVDKYQLSFNSGGSSQFVVQRLNLYMECYRGHYGNSSCSTLTLTHQPEEVSEAFVKWANKNKQLIFDGIAEELKIKAESLKSEARKDIEEAENAYKKVFGDL